jgi:DNA-binding response OmpR family regulator
MQAILVTRDPEEREILNLILRHTGLAVATTQELHRVAANWLERPADVIVVSTGENVGLAEAIESVRAVTEVPLLIITEPLEERQLCDLLQTGADLVLSRPVAPRVLAEYTRTLLRRAGGLPTFVLPQLVLDEISLDPATRTVTVENQEPQRLTQLEFRLLYVLMTNRDHVVPIEIIVERVWGYTGDGNRDLVRGLISRVRRKVEPNPDSPRYIQTIPGTGYRFSLELPLA